MAIDGVLQGDYSQLYSDSAPQLGSGIASDFGRTWLGQLTGFQGFTAREDYLRSEQQANNSLYRDLLKLQEQNKFNAQEAQKSRDFNALEAQKSRDWQEQMSNTAYQRAVADMRLAGINPVLAYQQGGSSTPASSQASSGSASSGSGGSHSGSRSGSGSGSDVVSTIAKIIAGAISAGATTSAASISAASALQIAQYKNSYNSKR